MNGSDALTTVAAYGALLVSAVSVVLARLSVKEAKRQADMAERAIAHTREAGHGATVIHFTSRFFDLMRGGPRFDDRDWTHQYWSLHATEFYFFDNAWLPSFMYELWMVELVSGYRMYPETLDSHEQYFNRYAINYPEMLTFFTGLSMIATQEFNSDAERNFAITTYVAEWPSRAAGDRTPGPRQPRLGESRSTVNERG